MKFGLLALLAILLQSCYSKPLPGEKLEPLNNSALYDPPTVTLIKGQTYHFEEGIVGGVGQKFHSDYSYLRALTIGQ